MDEVWRYNLMKLRDYQQEAIDVIWKDLFTEGTALCVLSTGAGKTVIIEQFLNKCLWKMPAFKAIVLMGRVQLVMQFEERFRNNIVGTVDTYCGTLNKFSAWAQVTIASIQSISKLENIDKVHCIIIDEVHNLNETDSDSRYFKFIEKLREKNEKLKVVAFTASPYRNTGYIYGKGKMFSRINYHKSLQYMIDNRYLVKPRLKSVDEQFDVSHLHTVMGDFSVKEVNELTSDEAKVKKQVEDALSRIKDRKKIIWQCSSIAHCELVHKFINEDSLMIHSEMSQVNQVASKEMFTTSDIRHLVFVTIVSEGWDYPPTDTVILMRPTKSPVLYVQTIGRALRPYGDKKDCLVLDYGKVVEQCGSLDFPKVRTGRISKSEKALVKACPKCREYLPINAKECTDCGYVFVKTISENRLSLTPVGGVLLAEPEIAEVRGVSIKKHISKNGNECLRIDYHLNDLLGKAISEFFILNAEFGIKRLRKRALELGLPHMAPIEELLVSKPEKIPVKIRYVQRKYLEVLSLIF